MRYAPSAGGRVGALLGGLLLTVVLSIGIPKLLIEGVLEIKTQAVLVGALLLIFVVGLVLTVLRVFVNGPVTIVTTPTLVELHRAGRVRETWLRADTAFSSFIVRQSTNGIPTGVTRKLIVHTAGERVEVELPWFAKNTFNNLIADVAPQVPAGIPTTERPTAVASTGTFTLDHAPVRRSRTVALAILAVGLIAAVAFVAIGFSEDEIGTLIIIAGSGLVLVVAVAGALILQGMRVPRELTVSPSTLTFDDRVFSIAQLSSIAATPSTYENAGGRAITLVSTTGQRTKVGLGRFGNRTFPDYERYLEALRGATAHRPGLFTLDVA